MFSCTRRGRPAASGLAGYWLGARNDEARDKRAAEREERARLVAREDRIEDERQAFQREVLLELQDRLLALTRSAAEVILRDRQTLRDEEKTYQLPEDLNKRVHEAGVALIRSRERVLNDELRHELKALQEFATELEFLALNLGEADSGQAVRQLDDANLEGGGWGRSARGCWG
jgi:hypothetical protein